MEINGIKISLYEYQGDTFASLYDLCLALGLEPLQESMNIQMDRYLKDHFHGRGHELKLRAGKIFIWVMCNQNYNYKIQAYRKVLAEELEFFFETETSTMRPALAS